MCLDNYVLIAELVTYLFIREFIIIVLFAPNNTNKGRQSEDKCLASRPNAYGNLSRNF